MRDVVEDLLLEPAPAVHADEAALEEAAVEEALDDLRHPAVEAPVGPAEPLVVDLGEQWSSKEAVEDAGDGRRRSGTCQDAGLTIRAG